MRGPQNPAEDRARIDQQARANALSNAIRNAIPVLEAAGYTVIPPSSNTSTPELA